MGAEVDGGSVWVNAVTDEVLAETYANPWAPEHRVTALNCLHVILNEEWELQRNAVRDLRNAPRGRRTTGDLSRDRDPHRLWPLIRLSLPARRAIDRETGGRSDCLRHGKDD